MKRTTRTITLLAVPVLVVTLSSAGHAQRRSGRSGNDPTKPTVQAPVAPEKPASAQDRKMPSGENSRTTVPAAEGQRTKPTGENLSPRQQGNIKQLQSDLNGIKQGSQVTQQQKDDLKNSLTAMAEGAIKPDPATVQKLADDLAEAISDGKLTANEKYKLSEDLENVMNSANIPEAEVEQAIADAQAILIASGVNKSDVQTIVYDMQQIGAEAKKNAQGAVTNSQGKAQGAADTAKEKTPAGRSGARRKP